MSDIWRLVAPILIVALVVGGFVAGMALSSNDDAETTMSTSPAVLTVPVEIRAIETVYLASGELRFTSMGILRNSGGTVTSVMQPGSVVAEGDAAVTIDLVPVPLLVGDVPAFRMMKTGTVGPDVQQLQDALQRLGYDPGTTDGSFGRSTRDAWKQYSEALGIENRTTVSPGDVYFTPAVPVRIDTVFVSRGDAAEGDLVAFTTAEPQLIATLPPGAEVDTSANLEVEVIVGQWHAPATVLRMGIDMGSGATELELVVDGEVPSGAPIRVRVAIVEDEGLVVPSTAIYTDSSGETYVRRWNGSAAEEIPVVIITAAADEAIVTGALDEGDELIVGTR